MRSTLFPAPVSTPFTCPEFIEGPFTIHGSPSVIVLDLACIGHLLLIIEAISKMPNSPISASGLNRNPRNIAIYSSGYAPAPSLTLNYFSVFEIAFNYIKKFLRQFKVTNISGPYRQGTTTEHAVRVLKGVPLMLT